MTSSNSSKRRLLLLSSSCLHGCAPFEYAKAEVKEFFGSSVKEILFVPYALVDWDGYTKMTQDRMIAVGLDFKVTGIHEGASPVDAVNKAQAIFIGGGNTFRLLKTLQDLGLIEVIRKRVLQDGVPYMGSSAGTNVATASINTTNDMPIVHPSTLKALALVPFNINPHYVEPNPNSTHKGETRDERILEFTELNDCNPVLALKEGAFLRVENDKAYVGGAYGARLFPKMCSKDKLVDIAPDSDVSYLL